MGLAFGNDDSVECIQNVDLKSPKGESLCLAHRTTIHFFGAGIYLTDNGYVLRPQTDSKVYYQLEPAQIERHQAEGHLPKPLPTYSISPLHYAFGYSLWIILAGCIAVAVFKGTRRRRREAQDAATPTSFGPPVLANNVDRYVDEQMKLVLATGETVTHQAYTLDSGPDDRAVGTSAFYVALTSARRLLFIKARQGAFRPLLENKGTDVIEADRIQRVRVDDRSIIVTLTDKSERVIWVSPTSGLSNQRAFLRDVPRILGGAQPASVVHSTGT